MQHPDHPRNRTSPEIDDGSEPDTNTAVEVDRAQVVRELHELIAALDRRVPQVHRVGELAIAGAAAALRDEALKRIDELARDATPEPGSDDPAAK